MPLTPGRSWGWGGGSDRRAFARVSRLLLVCLAVPLLAAGASRAGEGGKGPGEGGKGPRGYALKAEWLYQLALHVEWPKEAFPRPDSPFVIGIPARDPLGGVLDKALAGKTVNGRPVTLQRVGAPKGFRECHILFLSAHALRRENWLLDTVRDHPVLTVGETEGFAQRGGIINFAQREDGRPCLEVNEEAAKRAGIGISSRLLRVAVRTFKDLEKAPRGGSEKSSRNGDR